MQILGSGPDSADVRFWGDGEVLLGRAHPELTEVWLTFWISI